MDEAYDNAWKTFYSKENMIRVLSQWNDHPRNYWNLMSIFSGTKRRIDREAASHGGRLLRFKERKSRRPDTPSIFCRFISGGAPEKSRSLSSPGPVPQGDGRGLAPDTQKERNEERWLAQLQGLQTDVAEALRIGELQKIYAHAKESLSERAKPCWNHWTNSHQRSFSTAAISIGS